MFGRKAEAATAPVPEQEPKPDGKGRATPKRREAEKGRRRAVNAPKTRKEAYKSLRSRQREERTKQLSALRAGDERHLPPRDRGPVRKYARDFVDGRRSVAEFFLPLALVILVLTIVSNPQLQALGSAMWIALVVLIIVDSVVLGLRLRRQLHRRFPDQSTKGAIAYALMRSMQIRRFRLPPPRLKGNRRRT